MSPQDTASQLKEKGNSLFKLRRFQEAASYYTKAEAAAPKEAVYPSNLSAAFYELGDYVSCLRAICRTTAKLSEHELTSTLPTRLSTRFAKALSHGVRSGEVTPEIFHDCEKTMRTLSVEAEKKGATPELQAAWKDWRCTERDMEKVELGVSDARLRLNKLPILKKAVDAGFEYFSIGHDEFLSIIHDWGNLASEKDDLGIDKLPISQLSNLSFLFGGVGDARHVLSSLVGLSQAYRIMSKNKRSKLKAHFTLIDLHPTALSRDLCVFLLLDQLAETKYNDAEELEIFSTLFYIYIGVIIPSYCASRFHEAVESIISRLERTPPNLPSWLHIAAETVPEILTCLRYWKSGLSSKTTTKMLENHNYDARDELLNDRIASSIAVPDSLHELTSDKMLLAVMVTRATRMPDDEVIEVMQPRTSQRCPGVDRPRERLQWLEMAREMIAGAMVLSAQASGHTGESFPPEFAQEARWYNEMRVFVPPAALRKRHSGFDELWKGFRSDKDPTTAEGLTKAQAQIRNEWVPNPSLFDSKLADRQHMAKYPDMQFDVFKTIVKAFDRFNKRFHLYTQGTAEANNPAFSAVKTFFEVVVSSIRSLRGHFRLEIVCGDLMHQLVNLRLGGDPSRPPTFPTEFLRMWLSNVPDYSHGLLNTAIYCVPNLVVHEEAKTAFNCLLNSSVWKTSEEFCHHYTLLLPMEVSQYLGCSAAVDTFGITKLQRLNWPLPLHKLATHDDLKTWLSRLLFSILVPGVTSQELMNRVHYPDNLVSFVNLLVHLHRVGFPSHWISGFLATILSNTLVSDVVPYMGNFPVPLSERDRRVRARKVNLVPWHADLESILATGYESFPFPVILPSGFATSDQDIGLFSVYASFDNFEFATKGNSYNAFFPVVSLLFFKPGAAFPEPDYGADRVIDILEGKLGASGTIQIMTVVEHFDMHKEIIRWKMSKERARQMKREGWVMAPYRHDVRISLVYEPFPASNWKEL